MSIESSLIFVFASLLILLVGVFVLPRVGGKRDFAKLGCLFYTIGIDCFVVSMIMFIIALFKNS